MKRKVLVKMEVPHDKYKRPKEMEYRSDFKTNDQSKTTETTVAAGR